MRVSSAINLMIPLVLLEVAWGFFPPSKYVLKQRRQDLDCSQSAASPDGRYFAISTNAGYVYVFPTSNIQQATLLSTTTGQFIGFSPTSTELISAKNNQLIHFRLVDGVWTTFHSATLAVPLYFTAFSNDGKVVFTSGQFTVYDLATSATATFACTNLGDCSKSYYFHNTNIIITVGLTSGRMGLYDSSFNQLRNQLFPQFVAQGMMRNIRVNKADTLIAAGSTRVIFLLDASSWNMLCQVTVIPGTASSIIDFTFNNDGTVLVANSRHGEALEITVAFCAVTSKFYLSQKSQLVSRDNQQRHYLVCLNYIAVFGINSCPSYTYFNYRSQSCASCDLACNQCYQGSSITCLGCRADAISLDSQSYQCRFCSNHQVKQGNSCLPACIIGYYNQSGICNNCMSLCGSCIRFNSCNVCVAGAYYYEGICFTSCPPSSFATGFTCYYCPSECQSCLSSSFCLACNPLSFLHFSACLSKCPSGFYGLNSICLACSSNCSTCSRQSCLLCVPGKYLFSGICVSTCPASYTLVNSSCLLCEDYCQKVVLEQADLCAPFQLSLLVQLSLPSSSWQLQSIFAITAPIQHSFIRVNQTLWLINFNSRQSLSGVTVQVTPAPGKQLHPQSTASYTAKLDLLGSGFLSEQVFCPLSLLVLKGQLQIEFLLRFLIGLPLTSYRLALGGQFKVYGVAVRMLQLFNSNSLYSNRRQAFGYKSKWSLLNKSYPSLLVLGLAAVLLLLQLKARSKLLQMLSDYLLFIASNSTLVILLLETDRSSGWEIAIACAGVLAGLCLLTWRSVRVFQLLHTRLSADQWHKWTCHLWHLALLRLRLDKRGFTRETDVFVYSVWLQVVRSFSVLFIDYPTTFAVLALLPSLARLVLLLILKPFSEHKLLILVAARQVLTCLVYSLLTAGSILNNSSLELAAGVLAYPISLLQVLVLGYSACLVGFSDLGLKWKLTIQQIIVGSKNSEQTLNKLVQLGDLNQWQQEKRPFLLTIQQLKVTSDMATVNSMAGLRAYSKSKHLGPELPNYNAKFTTKQFAKSDFPQELQVLIRVAAQRTGMQPVELEANVFGRIEQGVGPQIQVPRLCQRLCVSVKEDGRTVSFTLEGKYLIPGFPLQI